MSSRTIVTQPQKETPDYKRTAIDRTQARSMVLSQRGVVATEHPLASQAGATVMARGGTAVDAAIAANAVMGVVAPMANGVGGDLFAIVSEPSGEVHGLNASGWAPAGLTIDFLAERGFAEMPQSGIHSVTVPGAVSGWALLHERFGTVPFGALLTPAIALAEEGAPVTELTAAEWQSSEDLLREDPESARLYLPDGRAPRAGEVFRNPDLAWTYRHMADQGPMAFYAGELAERIVASALARKGVLNALDLTDFSAEWVAPLSTAYRDWEVFELPPNGQGIAALMMLNIMEQFPIGKRGHNSADALHLLIEAKKLAYADMSRHLADPAFVSIPVETMLSKAYARERARVIDPWRAMVDPPVGRLSTQGGDTTYLCAVDSAGTMVSLIQSNFGNFGSGVVPRGAGFALQSRGGLFTLDATHPNALAPRKRPLHTIIPGFMRRPDQRVAFGIMGGWNQSQAHAQFVSNVVDHDMNIQAALEAARFTKLTFTGADVTLEGRVPGPVQALLTARGHVIAQQGSYSSMVGGGQSVMRDDAARVNFGASDPRKDGAAIPQPIVW